MKKVHSSRFLPVRQAGILHSKNLGIIVGLSLMWILATIIVTDISIAADGPIIIDHTGVDDFDKIPEFYLDKVRNMSIQHVGQSHGTQLPTGLQLLENMNPSKYAVQFSTNANSNWPPSTRLSFTAGGGLRVERSYYTGSNWTYWHIGDEGYWSVESGRTRTETTAQQAINEGRPFNISLWCWCWDMSGDSTNSNRVHDEDGSLADNYFNDTHMQSYKNAILRFNNNPAINQTRFIYHTHVTDVPYSGSNTDIGDSAWRVNHYNEIIRQEAIANNAILFDQADIETWSNDNSQQNTMTDYAGRTVHVRHPDYKEGTGSDTWAYDHTNDALDIRKAKALWVLLARLAGWDGRPPATSIATWAYPDSVSVPYRDENNQIRVGDNIHIGVVAYHAKGIDRVEFSVKENYLTRTVSEETLNPETHEYEYVFELNSDELATDGTYHISATVYSNEQVAYVLADLVIQKDTQSHSVFYVDVAAGDDIAGDGSATKPFKTIGRALGTQWEWHTATPRVQSGDIVKLKSGTYDLPDGQYATFTKYVTIMPDGGALVYMTGGTVRSSFLKFQSINFFHNGTIGVGGVTSLTGHHLWFKYCTYTGLGKIWPDTISFDEAFRSRDASAYVTLENFTVHDANQGLSLIGQGNYIIRNCHVYDQNGDGMKFVGENILITGNRVHDVRRPKAWSVSKNSPPYNFDTGMDLEFYLSTDYGVSFSYLITVTLSGSLSAKQTVDALNNNPNFAANFVASLSEEPYPYPGQVKIEHILDREQNQFYIIGSANAILNFSDNTRSLNNISPTYPAKTSTDHNDYMANDIGDLSNVIIRNNKLYGGDSQGFKFDGIGSAARVDFYKENVAIVNNLVAGTNRSARLLYFNYQGSGTPRSILHYHNFLIEHNTIFKPEDGLARAAFTIDMANPNIEHFVIKNNIIGEFHQGDWDLEGQGKGISDYNLFYPTRYGGGLLNAHSFQRDPEFVDRQTYKLLNTSPAIGMADTSVGIKYDLNLNLRDAQPDTGCYEYVPISFLFGDVNEDGEIGAFDAALAAHIAVDLEHPDIKNRAAAEVSGDGEVSAYDAALIAQKAVGLIEKFPVEQ